MNVTKSMNLWSIAKYGRLFKDQAVYLCPRGNYQTIRHALIGLRDMYTSDMNLLEQYESMTYHVHSDRYIDFIPGGVE